MSHDLDVAARLERLERLLDECRIPVTAGAGRGADTESAGILLNAFLDRIQGLASEVQSGIEHRHDADTLDGLTVHLLLEDYAAALRQLRASANETRRNLTMVANVIGNGRRLIRQERERQQ